jgi:predicted ArsR family transcriptional regulator
MSIQNSIGTDPPDDSRMGENQVRIAGVLRAAPGPLAITDIAERVGLHPNTVRFHLDRLAGQGLVAEMEDRYGGRGRPRVLYGIVPGQMQDSPHSYRLLARILIAWLTAHAGGQPRQAAQDAIAAGEAWGRLLPPMPTASSSAGFSDMPMAGTGEMLVAEAVATDPDPTSGARSTEVGPQLGIEPRARSRAKASQKSGTGTGAKAGPESGADPTTEVGPGIESISTIPSAAIRHLAATLDAIGFDPEIVATGRQTEILLHHCPFREIADLDGDVVCGIHLGLMQGVLRAAGLPAGSITLDSSPGSQPCIAWLKTHDATVHPRTN